LKKLLILLAVLLLGVPVVFAQVTDYFIDLEAPVFSFRAPVGTAKITSVPSYFNPNTRVSLNVNSLRADGYVFQAWLVDRSTDSWLNLGKFTSTFSGKGTLNFRINHYISSYDELVVTKEIDDNDPRPSRDVVLRGTLVEHFTARQSASPKLSQLPYINAPKSSFGHGQTVYRLS